MVELDGFGKPCPMPLVMCKKEIDAGNTDIQIRVDNDTAVKNITRLAKKKGLGCTVADIEGGFLITMGGELPGRHGRRCLQHLRRRLRLQRLHRQGPRGRGRPPAGL